MKNARSISSRSCRQSHSPRLSFWTKYDIESNYDYAQVEVSTNNGSTYTPLAGNYTQPGTGSFQPNGEPLYDGVQTSWVNEEMDLTLMTMCDNNIIANSSFSWWGAWLSNSPEITHVIAPKQWFGDGYNSLNTNDLLPERWFVI